MIHLPKRETKLLVAIHGWAGIVLGLALYAVVVTGMVAVFSREIGRWSAGVTRTTSPLAGPIDETVRRLAAQTPARFYEGLDLSASGRNDMRAFFHRHTIDANGRPTEEGVRYEVEAGGRTIDRRGGTGEVIFAPSNADALQRFFVDTHVRLHLPDPWGLLLTGILGLAMLVAAISGLLIHRHLLQDIFTLRRDASPVLAGRDRHSVAGTWSLPFAFALAFTGSFLSFVGSIGIPAMAVVAFGGDQQKLIATLIGTPGTPDARPARSGDLDRVLADATARAGAPAQFVSIANWNRADATITTSHEPRDGGLEPVSLVYSGESGAFVQQKPLLGARPSVGGAVFGMMAPIHFGNFAGVVSKAVWLGLGFAMCYVTLTGMQLWLRRREQASPALDRLDRTVNVVGFGLPLALVGAACGYFMGFPAGTATWWTPAAFLIAAAIAITAAAFLPLRTISPTLRGATGSGLLGLPLLRLASGGPGWGEAVSAGQPIVPSIDIALAVAGAGFLWSLRTTQVAARRTTSHALQAAE